MNMLHALVQGAGRTGRPLPGEPGIRRRAVVYVLASGGDVGAQVKGMSEEVREFIKHDVGCLRILLASYLLGSSESRKDDWYCSFCSKSSAVKS